MINEDITDIIKKVSEILENKRFLIIDNKQILDTENLSFNDKIEFLEILDQPLYVSKGENFDFFLYEKIQEFKDKLGITYPMKLSGEYFEEIYINARYDYILTNNIYSDKIKKLEMDNFHRFFYDEEKLQYNLNRFIVYSLNNKCVIFNINKNVLELINLS